MPAFPTIILFPPQWPPWGSSKQDLSCLGTSALPAPPAWVPVSDLGSDIMPLLTAAFLPGPDLKQRPPRLATPHHITCLSSFLHDTIAVWAFLAGLLVAQFSLLLGCKPPRAGALIYPRRPPSTTPARWRFPQTTAEPLGTRFVPESWPRIAPRGRGRETEGPTSWDRGGLICLFTEA